MIKLVPIALSLLGLIIAGSSLSQFVAKLKPTQAAGIAAGLTLAILPWLQPGEYSAFGISYKVTEAAKVQEVKATDEQFNALNARLLALEKLVSLSRDPKATPAQQDTAAANSAAAQQRYFAAARVATQARSHYVKQVDHDAKIVPGCGLRPDGSIAAHEVPNSSFGGVTIECDSDRTPRVVPPPKIPSR